MPEAKRPVLFCGENPIITLYAPCTEQAVAIASYWYCTYSASGPGHALVCWQSASQAPVSVLTDNIGLAQMLVETLTQYFPEFQGISFTNAVYLPAECGHTSDGSRYTAECRSEQQAIRLEWSGLLDQKQIIWPQFQAGPRAYDLTTVICPCQNGLIHVNGQQVAGDVRVVEGENSRSSSAFLAFAETWVGPV